MLLTMVVLLVMATGGAEAAGGWSLWTPWYDCTKTCEGGMQIRQRECDNPVPTHPADNCIGATHEVRKCNNDECPAPGTNFVAFCVSLTEDFIGGGPKPWPYTGQNYLTVPYDHAMYNAGGYFHFANHTFEAPVTGVYQFSMTAGQQGSTYTWIILQIKDGDKQYGADMMIRLNAVSNPEARRHAATTSFVKMNKHAVAFVVMWGGMLHGPSSSFCGMLVQRLE